MRAQKGTALGLNLTNQESSQIQRIRPKEQLQKSLGTNAERETLNVTIELLGPQLHADILERVEREIHKGQVSYREL